MLKIELKKTIIKNYILWFVILGIVLKIIFLAIGNYESNDFIEKNKVQYFSILDSLGGELNDVNEKKILDKYNALQADLKEKSDLEMRYADNQIENEQFQTEYIRISSNLKDRNLFNIIYQQYMYAKDDTKQHWIIYENGWDAFFHMQSPDFVMIILLIIINVLITGIDFENEMNTLLKTTQYGRKRLYMVRYFEGVILTILIGLIFWGLELISIHMRFGLYNFNAPLSSIPYFSDTSFNGTMNDAIFILVLSRILGCAMMSGAIMIITLIVKNILASLLIGLSYIMLPYFIQIKESSIYHLIHPLGLTIGKGFLRGNEENEKEGVLINTFESVRCNERWLIFCLTMACCLALFLFGMLIYLNIQLKLKKRNVSIFILLLCTMVSGCGKNENVVFNSARDNVKFEIEDGVVTLEDSIYLQKKDGQKLEILRNPFITESQKSCIRAIYGKKNKLYYLINDGELIIRMIDLKNFEEKQIFRYNYTDKDIVEFIGGYRKLNEITDWITARNFWIENNKLYILTGTTLREIDIRTKQQKAVCVDVAGVFSYVYNKLYYLDSDSQIICVDIAKEDENMLELYANNFYIDDGTLFYYDLFSHGCEKKYKLR